MKKLYPHKFNKRAFTLIEIIVVLIIIGILAAIALPNLFSNVQKSKASAAIASMDGIKTIIETCAAQNNTSPGGICTPQDYNLTSSDGFSYYIWPGSSQSQSPTAGTVLLSTGTPSIGNMQYSIVAYSADASPQYISLNRASNGTFTCSAPLSGPFAGTC